MLDLDAAYDGQAPDAAWCLKTGELGSCRGGFFHRCSGSRIPGTADCDGPMAGRRRMRFLGGEAGIPFGAGLALLAAGVVGSGIWAAISRTSGSFEENCPQGEYESELRAIAERNGTVTFDPPNGSFTVSLRSA